jgi:starvation-inducible outer membrane lipoprotein
MRYAILALPLALAACATAPKNIKAAYVAEPHYSCSDRMEGSLQSLQCRGECEA